MITLQFSESKTPDPTPEPKRFLTDRERTRINAERVAREHKKGRK